MRFHRLTVSAFGPYADTQTQDFDELNDAGLFLLTGPTGAGKSSILDAICFALYGVLPGTREVRALRSDHAAPLTPPLVELELTIGDRRFRVRRSPEWQRPKKRGQGTTRENAAAALTELDAAGERLVSARIAEVGHELGLLLGMTSEQFMQVVLLPQGEFQTFLQATSDQRQAVLQRLFRTERFASIETWVHERSRALGSAAGEAERAVTQLLATMEHRSGSKPPDLLAAPRLGDVGADARAWAADVVRRAAERHDRAVAARSSAESELDAARTRLRDAEAAAEPLRRRRAAEAVLAELEATAAAADEGSAALRAHERARLVAPLVHAHTEAATAVEQHRTAAATALTAAGLPADTDRDTCAAALRVHTEELATLRAAVPRAGALAQAETEQDERRTRRQAVAADLEELEQTAQRLPDRLREREHALGELRRLATDVPVARELLAAARGRIHAAAGLPAARTAHAELVDRSQAAREQADDAREHHLALVERRLAGMAGELAGRLVPGQDCPVCGGTDHPRPAERRADAVSEDEHRRAELRATDLRATSDALRAQVEQSRRSLDRLTDQAGPGDIDDLQAALDTAAARVSTSEQAAAQVPEAEAELAATRRQTEDLTEETARLRRELAEHDAALAALSERVSALSGELRTATKDSATPVATLVDEVGATVTVLETALAALDAVAAAEEQLADLGDRTAALAAEQGFAHPTAAVEAVLDDADAESLRTAQQHREDRRRAAAHTLEELGAGDGHTTLPDLDGLQACCEEASRRSADCIAETARTGTDLDALVTLEGALHAALSRWEPARAAHVTADGIARLVRGTARDNQLQMRLSSYVLATRLDQVLDAANERLGDMRDQRYTLRRCGEVRGSTRAGLGLEVLDSWTGEARSPTTLSGGETFVVSLALALGLADVVGHEAGAHRVETLFVDEGFGMLDPETLDDVMDRLDSLRAGGRTVGVVSHVPELRGRIPTQVHVHAGRGGSRVELRSSGGILVA